MADKMPKLMDNARQEVQEALSLEKLGDFKSALNKYKHALVLLNQFCFFTKNPKWFKQCKDLAHQYEEHLEEIKSRLEK